MRFETLAVHSGSEVDAATGAVTPPIHLSTTFQRDEDGSYPHGYVYSRYANPNRAALERSLALLDGGAVAAAFASGQAATASCFQALSPGDHVVLPADAYFGTGKLLRDIFGPWGLEHTLADMRDPARVAAAMRPTTRLVWVETPSNPLLQITDIAAVAEVAHAGGARLACDNTWATPALSRPLELGADLVMHATTKYLGGHSDVLGGALVSRTADEFFERVLAVQRVAGAVAAPFDCWLVTRGIRTLPYRVRAQSETAGLLAAFLARHPAVSAVHYPGLASHPGHEIAARQMSRFGAMLSIQVAGGRDRAMAVAAACRLFTRATSLGGPESLIEHRASNEGPDSATPQDLLRISVGLEHADDLIEDLDQALSGKRSLAQS